ncbi:DUF5684 domain-containing protein [Microbacterium sp. zg.Y1084]|uniref:DUF5684 domain-containing protein n=1 Tax=Microbacterium sp. zg.Y1084 TaxID=2969667 RepID=UPI00214B3AE8|nr:DUF5684 domain-containing protein [Microbacterium sp. zg.Y1084]MCR2812240.1 DUF5684 domain-containing protein [Microbacterium sp. zg.Y1084]
MTGLGMTADAAREALAFYDAGGTGRTPLIVLVLQLALVAGVYAWIALALSALFRKVGRPTWKAWVPVVNAWELFTLAGMRGWWAVVIAASGLVSGVGSLAAVALFAASALAAASDGDDGGAAGAAIGAILVPAALMVGFGVLVLILQVRMVLAVTRGFDRGGGSAVLGILLFPVWASVLGWGSARWVGLPSKTLQPSLTAPPPPPPSSPFTLGAPAAAHAPAPPAGAAPAFVPPAPAAPTAPTAAGTPASFATPAAGRPASSVAPAAPGPGANPWAPPAPPSPSPASAPAPASPASDMIAAPADRGFGSIVAEVPRPAPAPVPAASAPAAVGVHDADDLDERTVLAARRLIGWSLRLPGGETVALTSDAAVLGRNPVAPAEDPGAQVIPVDDATRTVSKTHALLRRDDADGWTITDLDSTNGVFLADESEVTGTPAVSGTFFLGDARLELLSDA